MKRWSNGRSSAKPSGNWKRRWNCPHKALPFVKAPAKAKLTRSIETQPGDHLATLSAFSIIDVPIMAARNKDMRRKRIMLGFHCRKLGFNITYRRSQSF